jgi:hypothetical protein
MKEATPKVKPEFQSRMHFQKVLIAAAELAVYKNQKDPEKQKNMARYLVNHLAELLIYTQDEPYLRSQILKVSLETRTDQVTDFLIPTRKALDDSGLQSLQ